MAQAKANFGLEECPIGSSLSCYSSKFGPAWEMKRFRTAGTEVAFIWDHGALQPSAMPLST